MHKYLYRCTVSPPTAAAACNHNPLVYFQVQQWMGKFDNFDSEQWGWLRVKSFVLSHEQQIFNQLQELFCRLSISKCKTDCDTRKWSCKRRRVEYSNAWDKCRGVSCPNSSSLSMESTSEKIGDRPSSMVEESKPCK